MAEDVGGGRKSRKEIKADEIVARLIPDPANPRVTRLTGLYLGNSAREDHWRLYLTNTFNHYFEFRKDDTLDAERPASGGVIVWLKHGAKVEETITKAVPESFLRGEFQGQLGEKINIDALRPLLRVAAAQGCGDSPIPCTSALMETCKTSCGLTSAKTCDAGGGDGGVGSAKTIDVC
jgi:hypothetical protein